jgi:hypothetical protein
MRFQLLMTVWELQEEMVVMVVVIATIVGLNRGLKMIERVDVNESTIQNSQHRGRSRSKTRHARASQVKWKNKIYSLPKAVRYQSLCDSGIFTDPWCSV